PPPSPKEAIEAVLSAARAVDSSIERTSLLTTALVNLDRDKAVLPADWVATTRAAITEAMNVDVRIAQSYEAFSTSMMTLADRRAKLADVRGLVRVLEQIHVRDDALGGKRPETIAALVAAVEEKLDAARRLQLARDRWAMQQPKFRKYDVSMSVP